MENNLKNMLGDYVTALEKENESLRKKCTDLESKIYKISDYVKKHTDKLKTIRVPKIDFDYNELLEILGDKENE